MPILTTDKKAKKLIELQSLEIRKLKNQVVELENKIKEKDTIINSFSTIREEMLKTMSELQDKHDEYIALIAKLEEMRNGVDKAIYKGKWDKVKKIIS